MPKELRSQAGVESINYGGSRSRGSRTATCTSPFWANLVLHGAITWPPRADTTPMVACGSGDRQCNGRWNPGYFTPAVRGNGHGSFRACEDCREGAWEKYRRYLIDLG